MYTANAHKLVRTIQGVGQQCCKLHRFADKLCVIVMVTARSDKSLLVVVGPARAASAGTSSVAGSASASGALIFFFFFFFSIQGVPPLRLSLSLPLSTGMSHSKPSFIKPVVLGFGQKLQACTQTSSSAYNTCGQAPISAGNGWPGFKTAQQLSTMSSW